jgi:hypothetical protein
MTNDADITTKIVNSLVEHWPLVVGLGIAVWKGVPWAIKAFVPATLKAYFSNGGGEQVRAIIKSENESQSKYHKEELDRRFRDHEIEEQRRFTASVSESKARFDAGEARFRAIEDDVQELAQVLDIKRKRRRTT